MQRITSTEKELRLLQQIQDAEVQQSVQIDVVRLVDASLISAKAVKDQEFRSFLEWLSTTPYKTHHSRHCRERLSGTAGWLLHNTQYMDWKNESDSSILLMHGLPGCGKTKLTSRVVDAFLHEKQVDPRAAPIAYFYCSDSMKGGDQVDAGEILRSLTRQLAVIDHSARQVHRQALSEYERRCAQADSEGFDVEKLDCRECVDLLSELLRANPAVLVIDGLDEIVDQPSFEREKGPIRQAKYELLKSLARLRDKSASVVKIFLSSREDGKISKWANDHDVTAICVQDAAAEEDMERFVQHCIDTAIAEQDILNGQLSTALRSEMASYLLTHADGM